MIQITVKNKQSQQFTNQGSFSTMDEATAWIAECEAVSAFGKPAHEMHIPVGLDGETEVVQVPAEYEIIITDITAQVEAEAQRQAKIEAGLKARQVCQMVLDYVAGANLDKALTIEQITLMQQTYANAEAALRAGRPTMAKMLINAIQPDGVVVTNEEKQDCLNLLSDY